MSTCHLPPTEERLREALARPSDFRVLERLVVADGETGEGDDADTAVGAVVDVETVGLADGDPVIELALRRFRFDKAGVITRIDRRYSWLQDPCVPVPELITRITGLRDEDVAGRMVDVELAERLLANVTVCIGHNARFDRPRVEALLPGIAGGAWACSMTEIAWRERHGFDGVRLGCLLAGCGYWHDAHRAGDDVDATIGLLRHRFPDGTTALAELVARAGSPGWIVEAIGAHFDMRDALRARGYRWDVRFKVWRKEIFGDGREAEEWWLAANVYDVSAKPKAMGPRWTETDWRSRHA